MKKRFVKTKIGDITFSEIPVPMFSRVLTDKELDEIRNTKFDYQGLGSGAKAITNDTFIEWVKDVFSSKHSNVTPKVIVYSEEVKQMLVNKGFPADQIVVLNFLPKDEKDSNS